MLGQSGFGRYGVYFLRQIKLTNPARDGRRITHKARGSPRAQIWPAARNAPNGGHNKPSGKRGYGPSLRGGKDVP